MSALVDASAARIYDQMSAFHDPNGDDAVLLALCQATARMLARPTEALRSDETGTGARRMYDPQRAEAWALPWLSQHAGLSPFAPELTEEQQRDAISNTPNFRRGTPATIRAAARATLTGAQQVFMHERDGGAYQLTVLTLASETPDPTVTETVIREQKPAGLVLNYDAVDAVSWDAAVSTWDTAPAISWDAADDTYLGVL